MKTKILSIITCLLMGCNMIGSDQSQAFELKVTNNTQGKIYPVVKSMNNSEDFGVVAIGKSATIGFSPFKLGDKIQVSWEEGESYDLSNVTIDTTEMLKIKNKVTSVQLIYLGNKKWIVKAFDSNDMEIGAIQ